MKVEVRIPDGRYCTDPTGWTCDLLGLSMSSDNIPVYCVRVNADVAQESVTLKPVKHSNCPSLKQMAYKEVR